MIQLSLTELGKPPKEASIDKFPAIIGRDAASAIVLQDKFVAAKHVEISEEGGRYFCKDLGSPNGTTLNGARIAPNKPEPLRKGDKLELGACEIKVTGDGAKAVDQHFVIDLDRPAEDMFSESGRRMYLPALLDVTRRLHGLHDAASICKAVSELAIKWLKGERALVTLMTKSANEIALKDQSLEPPTYSTTIAKMVMENGRALVLRDPRHDPSFQNAPSIVRGGALSAIAVPLWSGLGPEGMLYVDRIRDMQRFEADDLEYAMILACVAAQELEKAALVQRLGESEVLLRKENLRLRQVLSEDDRTGHVLGVSPAMAPVRAILEQVAPSDVTIFIHGETGTGKEQLARAIHELSSRADKPFVAINCGALPEQLLESELFGHKKGAFTGANEDRKGLCELANGGTLFLDEIGDMPLAVQVRFLRVLQEGEVRAVGSDKPRKVDVRVLSASHKDLDAEVAANRFRQDLLYRMNVVVIELPPLRARREDVPSLCELFIARFNEKYKKAVRGISNEALDLLYKHPFPGNIRELENEIQRALVLCPNEGVIIPDLLSPKISRQPEAEAPPPSGAWQLKDAVGEFERSFILRALAENDNHKEKTSKALGLTRQGLFEKMRRLGLTEREEE
ncbi:MAG: sigma 54-interacting transcriptional regulator [Deltaproteobacteria bacterium]|nr:sigma 54-interacting transcriptional regulator [Deltaproteobacteria bacterium]